ncbi:MAG: hypothetical protein JNK84_13530 [Phreatobacter sp.]|uniref:hypothetical protein n=1 Tax=Phreatobacter sp. TaxID=1966341 RepID=UPI001A428F5F|nr:hypothetical protein [Phreatobacter sp.]MBL8570086.1 hypothetical protein [Phreatobacter sp.]
MRQSVRAPQATARLVLFGVLGPPLGLATGLGVLALVGPGQPMAGIGILVLLIPTYFLGLVPALVTALIDTVLAERGTPRRMLWTTLAGAACGFILVAAAIGYSGLIRPLWLAWGLVGAAPAAICSWLAGRLAR